MRESEASMYLLVCGAAPQTADSQRHSKKEGESKQGSRTPQGSPKAKKAVEIAKNPLDIASYKLYYVNYGIRYAPPSPQPVSPHKGFDKITGTPLPRHCPIFGAAADKPGMEFRLGEPTRLVFRGFLLCEFVSDVLLEQVRIAAHQPASVHKDGRCTIDLELLTVGPAGVDRCRRFRASHADLKRIRV